MPVQKQTRAGQRTRFKAFVAIGDSNGHVGLGVKCSKEVIFFVKSIERLMSAKKRGTRVPFERLSTTPFCSFSWLH